MRLARLIDLFYPRECELCGKTIVEAELDSLCYACDELVEWISGRTCRRCGAGLPDAAEDERSCAECAGRALAFKGAVAAGRYAGHVRELVHRFKFRHGMHLAKLFSGRIARRLEETPWGRSVQVLVPVPTPLRRILLRGYSAAEVLTMRLSRDLGLPWTRGLRLRRVVRSQTELSVAERLRNPADGFAARPRRVRDKVVLLVDDVLTTGATASECTRVLRDAGAAAVYLAVIGR